VTGMATPASAAAKRSENAAAWRLTLLSAAVFAPIGLHLPYFPVWLAARGLGADEIATTLATPLILRVVLTPVIAYAADRQGIAATLAFCASAMLASYLALGWLAGFPLIFVGSAALIVAQGSMPALADALCLAKIRRFAKIGLNKLHFARIRVGGTLSVLCGMLLSGFIVAALPGENIIFALAGIALLPVVAAVATASRMPRLRPEQAKTSGLTADPADLRLAIIVILAAALVQASHAEIYVFGTLHWKASGFTPEIISLAWATGVVAEGALLMLGSRYLDTPGSALRFLIVGAAGAVLRWTIMAANPAPHFLLLLQITHALSFAATYIGAVLFLGSLAGPNHRARMQGFSSAAMALSMALATQACGYLTTFYGERAYLAMAALAAIGCGLALVAAALWRRDRRLIGLDAR
jgi:MFS transporter, PPP family, 3-phenylpropionic acid transporter